MHRRVQAVACVLAPWQPATVSFCISANRLGLHTEYVVNIIS